MSGDSPSADEGQVTRDVRSAPFSLKGNEPLDLHAWVDRSVLEVYVNGHTYLASQIYPQGVGGYRPRLFVEGETARLARSEGWAIDAISGEEMM